MSKISTVYDAVVSKMVALFPAKTRMHNPYELTDNSETIMKDTWGLKVLSADRNDLEFCNLTTDRQFSIILVRHFATVGSSGTAFDAVTKSLLEDQQTVMNNVHSPTELGIQNDIDKIDITAISGLEFIQTDQKKYLFVELTFTITISTAVI